MSFLFNNAAALAVALVASTLAWVFGGTRGFLLIPVVPWLVVLLLEILFCFPQRHAHETSYDARERVWRALKKDPLVWVAFGFFVLLQIPFVNNGLCVLCDSEQIAQGLDPRPPIPFLPFCVNRMDHLNVVLWFSVALLSLVTVRHALTSRGKRLLIELLVWNGVLLALLGFVQETVDAPGPLWSERSGLAPGAVSDFFSTFGYPNMAGDYFVTLFGLAVALWRNRCDELAERARTSTMSSGAVRQRGDFWRKHYFLIPAVIFFYSALNTLSRAAIILVTVSAVIFFAHAFISFLAHKPRALRVRRGVICLAVLGFVIFCSMMFLPEEFQKEIDTLNTTEVLDRVSGRGQYHTRVAGEIWKDHPLFGCGGWGYVHFCIPKMTPEELKKIQMVGGINVHNDHLQFLAEHGLVGFGALVALVLLLVWPVGRVWHKLAKQARFTTGKNRPPRPTQIFAMPAAVFCMFVPVIASLIHAFGDCPFRSPAVLTLFFIVLAAMPGFLPKMKEN